MLKGNEARLWFLCRDHRWRIEAGRWDDGLVTMNFDVRSMAHVGDFMMAHHGCPLVLASEQQVLEDSGIFCQVFPHTYLKLVWGGLDYEHCEVDLVMQESCANFPVRPCPIGQYDLMGVLRALAHEMSHDTQDWGVPVSERQLEGILISMASRFQGGRSVRPIIFNLEHLCSAM